MSHDRFVGVDLGTSAVKVALVTAAGRIVAIESRAYALRTPAPGRVELDVAEVEAALDDALRAILARGDAGEIAALGLSGAMHGVVPVDAAGGVLGPCVTWLDTRSEPIARRWRADGTASDLYRRTGVPVHPMLPSCKLAWFAENDPGTARAARFVSLKERVVFAWTGEWHVDPGIASATGLYDPRARAWDERALSLARIDPARLSTLARTLDRVPMRAAVASRFGFARRPEVVLGSSDGALANIGLDAVDPATFALTLGTSGAIRAVTADAHFDARERTFCYACDDARFLVGGATNAAGAMINAFANLLYADVAEDERIARALDDASRHDVGACVVLPFLAGERAPYWRADLRGAIEGLTLGTTRGQIVRAALESAVFALRTVYDAMRETLPAPRRLRLSGNLATTPFLKATIADTFELEVDTNGPREAAAFAAAQIAARALGIEIESMPAGETHANATAAVVRPTPSGIALQASRYDAYRSYVATALSRVERSDRH